VNDLNSFLLALILAQLELMTAELAAAAGRPTPDPAMRAKTIRDLQDAIQEFSRG